jgi:secretion/DNA translocation related TadE-like protein
MSEHSEAAAAPGLTRRADGVGARRGRKAPPRAAQRSSRDRGADEVVRGAEGRQGRQIRQGRQGRRSLRRPRGASGDYGAASLWVLGFGLAVLVFAGAVAAAGSVLVARHRAQAAADLGALAGAVRAGDGADVACARARQIVETNGARFVECRLDGLDAVVGVEVDPAGVGRAIGPARAWARAGPARASMQPVACVNRTDATEIPNDWDACPPGRAMVRCPQGLWRRLRRRG